MCIKPYAFFSIISIEGQISVNILIGGYVIIIASQTDVGYHAIYHQLMEEYILSLDLYREFNDKLIFRAVAGMSCHFVLIRLKI